MDAERRALVIPIMKTLEEGMMPGFLARSGITIAEIGKLDAGFIERTTRS
jgi:hypothetical protein